MSDLPLPARPVLGRALSAFGALVIAAILLGRAGTDPRWATVAGVTAAALWLVCALLTERGPGRLRFGLLLATVLISAPTAAPTEVTGLVPALVAIIAVVALPRRSFSLVVALPLAAVALVAVGFLLGGGTAAACSARSSRSPSHWSSGSAAPSRGGRRSRRSGCSSSRSSSSRSGRGRLRSASAPAIARDLHDVLAHSLGGLVIQLDAVDALLESGPDRGCRRAGCAPRGRSPPTDSMRPGARSTRSASPTRPPTCPASSPSSSACTDRSGPRRTSRSAATPVRSHPRRRARSAARRRRC